VASKSQQDTPSVDVEELLDAVDSTLDRLKTLYEQYFLGIQKQAPAFIHSDVERKLRDLAQINIRNTGLRYRLATLQQKFGSYNSYWRRTLRQIENGTYARNLAKIGREAAKNGTDIPEEILAAMPKRMREQVLRDRDQALALAKRRKQMQEGASEDGALDSDAIDTAPEAALEPPVPVADTPVRDKKTRGGAFVLDEDELIDYNALFSAFDADDAPKAGVRNKIPTVQPASRPQPLRMPVPNEQPRATPAAGTPPPSASAAQPAETAKSSTSVDAMINSIPRPVGQQPSQPTSSGVPRPVGQQPSQPTSSGIPRPVGHPPSQPTSSGTPAAESTIARVTPVTVAVPRSQDPSRRTGPVQAIDPSRNTGPVQAVDPSRQTTPVQAVDPSRQTPPVQAVDPSRQTGPVQTVDPSRHTGPMPAVPRPGTGQVPAIPRPAPSQQSRPIPVMPGSAAQTGPVPVESMSGPFPRTAASETSGPTAQRQTGSIPTPATTQRQTGPISTPATQRQTGPIPTPTTQRQTGPIQKPTPSSAPNPLLKPPPGMTEADVNALHAKYVQAKQAIGEKVDAGSRDKLLKTINQTAPKIMEQYKASGVDFSVVVKDNQVIIKAKPKT